MRDPCDSSYHPEAELTPEELPLETLTLQEQVNTLQARIARLEIRLSTLWAEHEWKDLMTITERD